MKLNTKEREDVVSTGGDSVKFKVQSSPKMFKLVFDGLYSDKPLAIVRETLSNAVDANIMAGNKDKPVDIIFPTMFNSNFRIRDYGEGLSPEFMKTKYTEVGYSSKEQSNDAVGMWGIGRLSPLSYTDSYTVVSYHRGKKYTYSVYLDRNSEPALKLYGEEDSTEPSGLEVSFPIQASDVNLFRTAFTKFAVGLDVKPNILNKGTRDIVSLEEPEVAFEGPYYKLYSVTRYGTHSEYSGARARMGCVVYPIDPYKLNDQDLRSIATSSMIIDFPIGSLAVTASREALDYSSQTTTIRAIEDRLTGIINTLSKNITKDILAAPTYFDACQTFSKANTARMPAAITSYIRKNVKWRGRGLQSNFYLNYATWYATYNGRLNSRSATVYTCGGYAKPIVLVVDESLKYYKQRLKQYVVSKSSCTVPIMAVSIEYYKEQTYQDYLHEMIGTGHEVFLKDTPEYVPPKRAAGAKKVQLKIADNYGNLVDTILDEKEQEEGGYVVNLEKSTVVDPKFRGRQTYDIKKCFNTLKRIGEIPEDKKLYFVQKSVKKKTEGKQWINFGETVEKFLKDRYKDIVDYCQIIRYNDALAHSTLTQHYYHNLPDCTEYPVPKTMFNSASPELLDEFISSDDKYRDKTKYCRKIQEVIKVSKEKFPMLGFDGYRKMNEKEKEYVKIVLEHTELKEKLKEKEESI